MSQGKPKKVIIIPASTRQNQDKIETNSGESFLKIKKKDGFFLQNLSIFSQILKN